MVICNRKGIEKEGKMLRRTTNGKAKQKNRENAERTR